MSEYQPCFCHTNGRWGDLWTKLWLQQNNRHVLDQWINGSVGFYWQISQAYPVVTVGIKLNSGSFASEGRILSELLTDWLVWNLATSQWAVAYATAVLECNYLNQSVMGRAQSPIKAPAGSLHPHGQYKQTTGDKYPARVIGEHQLGITPCTLLVTRTS